MKMKKIHIYNILLLMAVVMLASCKDDIRLDGSGNTPELVVYCFPSTADTTFINVSRSLPVSKYTVKYHPTGIDDATITYTVNGQPQNVCSRGDGSYYVVARQQPGDKIAVEVSADGLADAGGETTIPDTVALGPASYRTVSIGEEDWNYMESYYQFIADFTDPAASSDYYAARVRMKIGKDTTEFSGIVMDDGTVYGDSIHFHSYTYYPKVYTQSEPLMNPVSNIDDSFGFSSDFYQDLCIFNDASINGQTYRLHLNVLPGETDPETYGYTYSDVKAYRVEVLHLTPELYRFLQSINAVENSDLAQHGLAQIQPTLSNVHGGFGLIAGWNVSRSDFVSLNK